MPAVATPLRALPRDAVTGAAIGLAAGGLALLGGLAAGPPGLLAPVVVAIAVVLLLRPVAALVTIVTLVVLFEGDRSGFLPASAVLYESVGAGVAPIDAVLALATAAAALDVVRRGEPLRLPGPLTLPLALLALAIAAGVVVGYGRGAGPVDMVFEGRSLVYLVVLPLLAVNVLRTQSQVLAALALVAGLAVVKAVVGLLGVGSGQGRIVEGTAISYYEPLANLIIMLAVLAVPAAYLLGERRSLPRWLIAAWPLMLACFVLSFRRSFWIGLVLGGLLVLALALSPAGRRLVVPIAALLAAAVWALGSTGFETQGPVVERVQSLRPSSIAANAEDRYRGDERANVVAELRDHPIAGLGLSVGWSSAERPLPVDHENGRLYVHNVALWWWLKLGVLGLVAYLALLAVTVAMSWRVWRRHPAPRMRVAGLTLVCGTIALAAIETTGSYTGVENRVSIFLGLGLGALAVAYREASSRSTSAATA